MTSDAAVQEPEELKQSEGQVDESEAEEASDDSIHWIQRFYDNPWILLALGILIPFLSYTLWGWVELMLIEPAQLP